MRGFATVAILSAALTIAVAAPSAHAGDGAISAGAANVSYLVIGFAGGFVRHDNLHHGPVLMASHIQKDLPHGAYVQVFENRRRRAAFQTIVRLLDSDHDGTLSDGEKTQAHIILFGHSWGASAAVLLARELQRIGVPVLLTVQVDSVPKLWQHDTVIPENVAAAANFYQPHGLIHGTPAIRAEDASKTQILGNYRFDYSHAPVKCEGITWLGWTLTRSHLESQCDPQLWTEVETLVRDRMKLDSATVAALPQH